MCSCPSGYILRPNQRICKEINECKLNRGGCSHGCKNTPGSYECTCPRGFQLEKDNKTCVDINECAIDNGGCEIYCKNYKGATLNPTKTIIHIHHVLGSFRCHCPPGSVLQKDRKSCSTGEIRQCRVPEPPENGEIRCVGYHIEYGLVVPSGTKCNVWCNEGFKLKGRPQRHCNDTGNWDNSDAECVG